MKCTIVIPNRYPFPMTAETDEYIHFQENVIYTYCNSPYHPVAENVDCFSILIDDKTLFRVIIPELEPNPLELDRQGNILFVNNTILLYGESGYTVLAENVTGFEVEWL
jgi:hypothetical protein